MFNWQKLRRYLAEDEQDPKSSNDFGKNILPTMLNAGERMFAYPFEGYWKDVGTIDSLWEANMDLLDPNVGLDLSDSAWRIYSRNPGMPPQYISETAKVQNSIITEGSVIHGNVDFSVIFSNVTIGKGATVRDSIIMPGAVIEDGATVQYAIISENAIIKSGAVVGARPETMKDSFSDWGVAVVGDGITVGKGAVVAPKAMIDKNVK